ncbi:MAG TPA: hypothetical protein VK155_18655 [Bacteroidales bacterium]|nr:hypothetical protein [Bacteroidales bacterium]
MQTAVMYSQPANSPAKSKVYLSASFGPSFFGITDRSSYETYHFNGLGLQFDVDAGFALSRHLFMHFTYTGGLLSNPTIKVPNMYSPRPSDEISFNDRLTGGGFTWYPAKEFYLTLSAGAGLIKLNDKVNPEKSDSSERGPSFRIKVGREWKISERFGAGICFTYGKTWTSNISYYYGEEKLTSNRFGFLCTVTMH